MADASSSADRTILVTGGTGTVGRVLVRRFVAQGASVVVLTRDPARAAGVLPAAARVVTGDVVAEHPLGLAERDRGELQASVTDIVHCAAETTFNRPLEEARVANVGGTRAVLAFARECPRLGRVACFSTVYVAGQMTGCFGETDIGGA